jgi:hypothetical protein
MKIIVATLVAFLLGTALVSTEVEARCWWNGYNHCRYDHHGYYVTAIGTAEHQKCCAQLPEA